MSIRNFEDIHSIRKELRKINLECTHNSRILASVKRILTPSRLKILSASSNSTFSVRQDYGKAVKETKEQKVSFSALEKLTNLLSESDEKAQLAEHIHQLLQNHFNTEDGAVIKKLTELSKQLVKETKTQQATVDKSLNEQADKLTPKDFKQTVNTITKSLFGEFDIDNSQISTKYYAAVDKIPSADNEIKRILFTAFIVISNLKTNDSVRDLVIAVTRRTDYHNTVRNFVRTFTHKVSPVNLLKNNLGVEFGDDPDRAFKVILTALKVDNVVDSIDPTQIPVRKKDIKFTNTNIKSQDIDEDNGVITLYLNTAIQTEAEANKVLQDVFVETKQIIKAVHPRNRNPIRVTSPRMRKVRVKMKDGSSKVKNQFFFKIMFSKPESGAAIELPRDKIKQFMKIMQVENPETAKEFNLLLKRFLGA